MPPSDDDLGAEALQTLMALDSDLDRALNGPMPNPAHSREIAHDMRGILADAERRLGDEHVEPIRLFVERAQGKALRIFGTSGWDEPSRQASAREGSRVGIVPASVPLTDDAIEGLVAVLKRAAKAHVPVTIEASLAAQHLAAEILRLRSGEWLKQAAEEIARNANPGMVLGTAATVAAILRKHRDRKA